MKEFKTEKEAIEYLFSGIAKEDNIKQEAIELILADIRIYDEDYVISKISERINVTPITEPELLNGEALFFLNYLNKLGIVDIGDFTKTKFRMIDYSYDDFFESRVRGERFQLPYPDIDYYMIEKNVFQDERHAQIIARNAYISRADRRIV